MGESHILRLLLAALSIAAIACSVALAWRSRRASFLAALAWTLFPLIAAILVAGLIDPFRLSLYSVWPGGRLATAVAMAKGYRLYYGPDFGPALATIYGPVSALVYLPAAALRTPSAALFAGYLISLLLTLGPFALACRQAWRGDGVPAVAAAYVFLLAALLGWIIEPVNYAMTNVHANAPALAFGWLACLALHRDLDAPTWRTLFLAAICLALSAASKQTMAALAVGFVPALWWRAGRGAALRFLAAMASVSGALALVLGLCFGFREMYFNLVTIPGRHDWQFVDYSAIKTPWDAIRIKSGWFLSFSVELLGLSALPAVFALGWLAIRRVLFRASGGPPARHGLTILAVSCAAASAPVAVLGLLKQGGGGNSYGLSLYFAVGACVAYLLESARVAAAAPPDSPRREARALAALLLAACLGLGSVVAWDAWRQLSAVTDADFSDNPQDQAYRHLLAHPGEVYFAERPLAHLMAEGKLYHYFWGLHDRRIAGFDVSPAHFRADIPPQMKSVAVFEFSARVMIDHYLPGYVHRVPLGAFPRWSCFSNAPPADAPTH